MKETQVSIGQKIYFCGRGDEAAGWFTVSKTVLSTVCLSDGKREIYTSALNISDDWARPNTPFLTKKAYKATVTIFQYRSNVKSWWKLTH